MEDRLFRHPRSSLQLAGRDDLCNWYFSCYNRWFVYVRSMEIVVLSASRQKNCTLKDVAGGFGTVFTVGNSPFAKLLEIAKRRIASIPNITLAYLDSLLSSHGANVRVLEIRRRVGPLPRADLHLIASYGRAAPPAGIRLRVVPSTPALRMEVLALYPALSAFLPRASAFVSEPEE